MTESKIQKQLIDYFTFFEEFNSAARTTLRDCQNCAATINKLIKRCNNIHDAQVAGSPLAIFRDLQDRLCASLHNLITDAISEIRCKQCLLDDLAEKLYTKNKALRDTCRESDLDENSPVVKGSPTQPSLKTLLQYADDTITFASHSCAQIETALNILSLTQLNTTLFGEHFSYPIHWSRRITEIIRYTSFLSST